MVIEARSESELLTWLGLRNELEPDDPWTLDHLLALRAAEPERRELLARLAGEVVGVGSVGPKGAPEDLTYGYLCVTPTPAGERARLALFDAIRAAALGWGRSRLELWAAEDDAAARMFLMRRGFQEAMRESGLALDLPAAAQPAPPPPPGLLIQPVASDPAFGDGAYAVAARTWRDIPGETGILEREAWLELQVRHAAAGAQVGLVDADVVGFAGLHELAAPGHYEHGLLAVLPQHRRHGVARSLKLAQIDWATRNRGARLVTWNAEANLAARGLNLSLGYRPLPAAIAYRGGIAC